MRILVLGAGATGGYFGGRLLEAGRDVTFLVRPRRAAQLAETGLAIKSVCGDVELASPPTIASEAIAAPFDLVLLSCKAYDLDAAIDAIAPAVGEGTAIVPMLNGMAHLDRLAARFGTARVLGGVCLIAATLDDDGRVLHLNDTHALTFGERAGGLSRRVEAIEEAMAPANFTSRASAEIILDMWEKWVFLATAAGITCLMRAAIGDIAKAGGAPLAEAMLDEARAIAAAAGYAPRPSAEARSRAMLTAPTSMITASMMRDVEHGGRIEVDHVIGDLIRRGEATTEASLGMLRLAHIHLKAYETRRAREAG